MSEQGFQYQQTRQLLEMDEVTKSHWETIQQWRVDEGKNFARSRSTLISRMAAGGLKAGSTQWETNLAQLDTQNKAALDSMSGSATQGILDRWTAQMKDIYVNAANEATYTTRANKGNEGGEEYQAQSGAGRAVDEFGGGKNPYSDFLAGGGTTEEYKNMSTDDFMKLSYGTTDTYKTLTDESGEQAAAAAVERTRQDRGRSQTQQASPWWA